MQTPMSDYQNRYDAYRLRVEEYLHASLMVLPEGELRDAMAYSLFGGGKLLRPVLTLAACDLADGVIGDALDDMETAVSEIGNDIEDSFRESTSAQAR